MDENNLKQLLERLAENVDLQPEREYWMVRTSNGDHYVPFLRRGVVALQLPYITNQFISDLRNNNADNVALQTIQSHMQSIVENQQHPLHGVAGELLESPIVVGTRAKQLFNFCFKMKTGDMVLIPDEGASYISIGIISDDYPVLGEDITHIYPVVRRVHWVNQIPKNRLESGLYRALGAHQALANISKYSEYLERNYGSCFMIGDACHYVLAINSEQVSADQFFGMGDTLMKTLKKLSEHYDLGVNTEEIHLSMNLNSPGKVDFIANKTIAFLIMALLTACSNGNINFNDMQQIPQDEFNNLVNVVRQPIQQEGDIKTLTDSLVDYLNGTEAQAVEQYNQNTMNALRQREE